MIKDLKYYLSLNYKTILEYEPDDFTWVAYCPELGRGSCYGIGETQAEALSELEIAKKELLQLAIEEGQKIPEPVHEEEELPSGQFIVRVPKSLHRDLKELAEKENVSLNQLVLASLSQTVGFKKASDKIYKSTNNFIKSFSQKFYWNNENSGRELSFFFNKSLHADDTEKRKVYRSILFNQLSGRINVKIAEPKEKNIYVSESGRLQETTK